MQLQNTRDEVDNLKHKLAERDRANNQQEILRSLKNLTESASGKMVSAEFDVTDRTNAVFRPAHQPAGSMANIAAVLSEPELLGPVSSKNLTQRAPAYERPMMMFTAASQSAAQFRGIKRVESCDSSLVPVEDRPTTQGAGTEMLLMSPQQDNISAACSEPVVQLELNTGLAESGQPQTLDLRHQVVETFACPTPAVFEAVGTRIELNLVQD